MVLESTHNQICRMEFTVQQDVKWPSQDQQGSKVLDLVLFLTLHNFSKMTPIASSVSLRLTVQRA